MHIPVLVERIKGNGYRARGAEPLAISARGATREEALSKLRAKIEARLKKGAELVNLDIAGHPWLEFAGMFQDDPMMDEWVQSMAEHRKQVDDDPAR